MKNETDGSGLLPRATKTKGWIKLQCSLESTDYIKLYPHWLGGMDLPELGIDLVNAAEDPDDEPQRTVLYLSAEREEELYQFLKARRES